MKTKLILGSFLALGLITSVNAQWSLTGNAGTSASNFVGTTDGNSLRFRVNNVPAGYIDASIIPGNNYFGYRAGISTTSGYWNTLVGAEAGASTNSGNLLSGIGWQTQYFNTSGYCNSSNGVRSLYMNDKGHYNTANGYVSMYNNIAGFNNTADGAVSLYNNDGSYNTAEGAYALYNNTGGSYNSALGSGADVSTGTFNNATAIGSGAIVNSSNRVWIGSASDNVWCQTGLWNTSDERFKNSVREDDVKGLEFIKLLRPVAYNFDTRKLVEYTTRSMPDSVRRKYLSVDFTKSSTTRQNGFLAQEVLAAAQKSGYDFSGVHSPEGEHDTYGLQYAQFVVPLVKAVQEQQAIIEQQNADHLQQMQDLQKQLEEQKQIISTLQKGSSATGIGQNNIGVSGFQLEQNEPNPFSGETVVNYNMPQSVSNAYLAVYDLSGKQIATFPLTQKGEASITISSDKLVAGIYIYSVIADNKVMDSKRMIVTTK